MALFTDGYGLLIIRLSLDWTLIKPLNVWHMNAVTALARREENIRDECQPELESKSFEAGHHCSLVKPTSSYLKCHTDSGVHFISPQSFCQLTTKIACRIIVQYSAGLLNGWNGEQRWLSRRDTAVKQRYWKPVQLLEVIQLIAALPGVTIMHCFWQLHSLFHILVSCIPWKEWIYTLNINSLDITYML